MTYKINGVEITEEEFNARPNNFDFNKTMSLQTSSFAPFQSPIDGSMITSTKNLKDHNRVHGVQQVGHDYEKRLNKHIGRNENARN